MDEKCKVISVVLTGENLDQLQVDAVAERIHRCVRGEALEDVRHLEFRSCDGITIGDSICIGSSK